MTCHFTIKATSNASPSDFLQVYIVLHENHKGNCSGQMVPTSKIYGIGSWTNTAVY